MLSRNEREEMSAVMMVRDDRLDIDPNVWTPKHLTVIRAAAQEPAVERIFVNAAIKKALCREAKGDRGWLSKVRPDVRPRLSLPYPHQMSGGQHECECSRSQPPRAKAARGDFAYWFKDAVTAPQTAERAAEAEAADDAGAVAAGLPSRCCTRRRKQLLPRDRLYRPGSSAIVLTAITRSGRKRPLDCRNGASACRNSPQPTLLRVSARQSCMERLMTRPTWPCSVLLAATLCTHDHPRAAAGQDPHRLRRRLDEERARRIDAAYTAKTGVKVVASYAASSALAKQIEQGAPADVFVSADTDWMDYASEEEHQGRQPRFNLLGNSIVLIAPKDSKIDRREDRPGLRSRQARRRRPHRDRRRQAVPAGKYAKAALEKLGAWTAAEPKFAMAENVRAALTLVARGEAVLGIVYETDAKVEPGVKIVGMFPEDSHPPIIYPVAATDDREAGRRRLISHSCARRRRKTIFEKYGFTFLSSPTS